jgi:hypothetical protein
MAEVVANRSNLLPECSEYSDALLRAMGMDVGYLKLRAGAPATSEKKNPIGCQCDALMRYRLYRR